MGLGNPPRDRQPEAGAVRRADANESLENPVLVGRRDPRAVVGDPQHHLIRRPFELGGDRPAASGMANGVVEQVADHLSQQRVVAGQADFFRAAGRRRYTASDPPARAGLARFPQAGRRGSGTRAAGECRAASARESRNIASTSRDRRVACSPMISSDSRYSSAGRTSLRQRHLRRRPHDRDRRPQLVRGVGHELTLQVQRRREPIEQPIEGRGEVGRARRWPAAPPVALWGPAR